MPTCKTCYEVVENQAKAHGYNLSPEDIMTILWEATPYPAGCGAVVEQIAKEFFEPGGTLDELREISMDKMFETNRKFLDSLDEKSI